MTDREIVISLMILGIIAILSIFSNMQSSKIIGDNVQYAIK